MIRAVIIDDEPMAREAIKGMLAVYCPDVEVIEEAGDISGGLMVLRRSEPDLVFLDIQLTDGTGFELLKRLESYDFRVIFITAFEDYAVKAFKFSAIDYILKPVDPNELMIAVKKVRKTVEKESMNINMKALFENISTITKDEKKVVLKTASNVYLVNLTDIIRCEADKNYTHFFVQGREKILVSRTLKEFEEMLSEYNFVRVHQSHLVNLSHVIRYDKGDGGTLIMSDNSEVPVSFRKKDDLMKAINGL
jgi:two-component system LytT family response regulator